MKTKILFIVICNLLICNLQYAQNITNTLGTSGVFKIKDGSTDYFTLSQSTGQVNILNTLRLENTISSTTGIIFKGANRFMHNFGTNNTFLGVNSGNFTMVGGSNTALGLNSFFSNTFGDRNTALGMLSLFTNAGGYQNTAVGHESLFNNTDGYFNTAVGMQSLYNNGTGNNNSAFGHSSLRSNTGTGNSAFGSHSLYTNDAGYNNSAFGGASLYTNSTGFQNSAFGNLSLYNNTASNNSAFGFNSLYTSSTGTENSAFGHSSLYNSTGNENSAFGFQSLYTNSTGGFNSAFGYNSLYNSTGNYNTAIGLLSGSAITTGFNNTAIGYDAQVPTGTLSNQVRIGNTAVTYAGIQVAWTITSDRRWKENILPSSLGLSFISKLNPVSYTRKNDENGKTEYGLIAQEVEEVLKEEGVENSGMLTITDEGMYELRYNDLMSPMIKAIQELKTENDELKERLAKYEEVQNMLANEIEKMKAKDEMLKQVQHDKEVKLGEK